MSENGSLIEARDLRKSYRMGKRSLEVLRGISIRAEKGEFLAVKGASGAGKSTLLHLLGGLDRADAGEIRFAGVELQKLSGSDLARLRNRKIGFIFQAYHLMPELEAWENVALPARIARRDAGSAAARAKSLLERVGLKERIFHRPNELSGGEQQRVAIARSLINDPELIIADEPTGNLDSHTGGEIIELLMSLRAERGTTLMIATHDSKIAQLAPRLLQLRDGQLA